MLPGPSQAKCLLDSLAAGPRGAGSPGESRARALCAGFLGDLGYDAREEGFTYSTFAGRMATPLAGAILLSLFLSTAFAFARVPRIAVWLLAAHCVLLVVVAVLAGERIVRRAPFLRRSGVNLSAVQGEGHPALWLMAHIDSKSQGVSILARAAGVVICAALLPTYFLALLLLPSGDASVTALSVLAALGVCGCIPLLGSAVGDDSAGALDNATGVVAVLLAVSGMPAEMRRKIGVVITSAEELGLAGAHCWAEGRAAALAINCDTVDDAGGFLCLSLRGRGSRGRVRDAVLAAAAATETPVRVHRMIPGVLVDSMALESRGWDVVTLSKGTVGTLQRIHTREDSVSQLRATGALEAAALIRAAAQRLFAG
jgi:hypothetical protein